MPQDPRVAELFKLIAGYREQWAVAAECFEGAKKIADDNEDVDIPKKYPGSEKDCYWEKSEMQSSGSTSTPSEKKPKKASKQQHEVADGDSKTPSASKPKAPKAKSSGSCEKLEDAAEDSHEGLSPEEVEELKQVEKKIRELEAQVERCGHDVLRMQLGVPHACSAACQAREDFASRWIWRLVACP